ncbi:MAG: hypothetical protein HEQ29_18160 [Dolichospermum sp. LBC05a]|jgi:hypothetical protein|nr:hypothetical protein [Dolichospermum sp. OL01]MCO5798593.1 hypothetical protein [Dolichospermum sp. OL03]MCS6279300.1 hypothetical protein [Dolichospermum sp.]OBQ36495.1 MAG: hypothetical protein AN485_11325 [Anabaena sp. MDT14b]QSV60024.1 MAG: hypothetical protein HEQ29_18160 [Dolichospermum sp. LBC05a]
MKAVELVGTVNTNGQINLDQALTFPYGSRVKVIVLLPELIDQVDGDQEIFQPIGLNNPKLIDTLKMRTLIETSLTDMANDPEIQREIGLINAEFEISELDGIERL